MAKKNSGNSLISDEDKALFRDAVKEVKPLDVVQQAATTKTQKEPSTDYRRKAATRIIEEAPLSAVSREHFLPDSAYEYSKDGLQPRLFRKLKQGQLPIQSKIDCHGMTLAEAEPNLHNFISRCAEQHYRCIKIIHGKGKGTKNKISAIQNLLYQWLPQQAQVLAFCSAQPKHGGTGATYVLLKRTKTPGSQ